MSSGKVVYNSDKGKIFKSDTYNYIFNKIDGTFIRWGRNRNDDPALSIYGPEIADIEISEGNDCIGCDYCYKNNGSAFKSDTYNMTLDEFKIILSKMPDTLCQIAFGIMQINTNPDFFPIMEYTKSKGIIPNYTTNGFQVTDEIAKKTKELCGAVAISVHSKEVAYNAINKFISAGMTQVNIHYVLSKETYQDAFKLIDDVVSDPRLKGLNAIVFLKYKPKGNNIGAFTQVSLEDYKTLIHYCDINKVNYGMDSCSAPMVFKAFEGDARYTKIAQVVESCESSKFSIYCNAKGDVFPCSFTEGELDWETGLSMLTCNDFLTDIWNHERLQKFREKLLCSTKNCVGCISQSTCNACPTFNITPCRKE